MGDTGDAAASILDRIQGVHQEIVRARDKISTSLETIQRLDSQIKFLELRLNEVHAHHKTIQAIQTNTSEIHGKVTDLANRIPPLLGSILVAATIVGLFGVQFLQLFSLQPLVKLAAEDAQKAAQVVSDVSEYTKSVSQHAANVSTGVGRIEGQIQKLQDTTDSLRDNHIAPTTQLITSSVAQLKLFKVEVDDTTSKFRRMFINSDSYLGNLK